VSRAYDQNWRVVGPRTIVVGPIFPRCANFTIVSYEQGGRNGCDSSRTCQGPIAFCVA
jgi:hypothetical protein